MVRAIEIARPQDAQGLALAIAGWGLADRAPVVVLVGGAGALDGIDLERTARAIEDVIIPAVMAAGAAILDGGTDAGVIGLAGRARRGSGAAFPLVGVVPASMVDAPQSDLPAIAQMQPDHSHLLAVPGERWGDETPWLFDAARLVAGDRPVVTVVLNGGQIARREVEESLRRGGRAIVVSGTGRAADEIAVLVGPDGLGVLPEDGPARDGRSVAPGLVQVVPFDEDERLREVLRDALTPGKGGSPMTQTPSTGRPARVGYEEEMLQLIDELGVTDEQRVFLRSRWLDQVTYMGDRATDSKRRYYSFRLATVIGGVIVPALVSISLAGAGRFNSGTDFTMRLLTFLVSAVVAVTASVDGFFHFGDRWRHFRVNAELLKSEGWQYLTHTGGYRRADDAAAAFQTFAARVEGILRDDVEGFMADVASGSAIEKHDIFTKV